MCFPTHNSMMKVGVDTVSNISVLKTRAILLFTIKIIEMFELHAGMLGI